MTQTTDSILINLSPELRREFRSVAERHGLTEREAVALIASSSELDRHEVKADATGVAVGRLQGFVDFVLTASGGPQNFAPARLVP